MDNDIVEQILLVRTREFTVPRQASGFEDIVAHSVLNCVRDFFLNPLQFDKDFIDPLDETVEHIWENLSVYYERDLFHYLVELVGTLAKTELANKDYDDIFDQFGYIKDVEFTYEQGSGFILWRITTK